VILCFACLSIPQNSVLGLVVVAVHTIRKLFVAPVTLINAKFFLHPDRAAAALSMGIEYEFEARIGTFSNTFRSGVTEKEFSMLKLLLAKKKPEWRKQPELEETVTFTWQNPMVDDRAHLRVIFGADGRIQSA
jgi:hypothetical protein